MKIPSRGGKFIINRARHSLPQIDKALPPRRNLIPTISLLRVSHSLSLSFFIFPLSLSFPFLSLRFSTTKRRVASWEQTFMKTRLTGSLLGFSFAPAFFTRGSTVSYRRSDATYVTGNFHHAIPTARKFLAPYAAACHFPLRRREDYVVARVSARKY